MEENDNIELLEAKAVIARKEAQAKRKQIPPFVQKLSRYASSIFRSRLCSRNVLTWYLSFLDESKNTELIRWSDRGDSFVVLDEDEFAKTLIPELFKHNNYASFVRQLNMYGFHKRVGLSDNSMKASERKNKSPSEYYNPCFKRGHPNLLWLINKPKGQGKKGSDKKRVKDEQQQDGDSDDDGRDVEEVYGNNVQTTRAISAAPEAGPLQRQTLVSIQNQVAEMEARQGQMLNAIQRLRKDHNQLYQQSVAFQNLHDRHENSINAILTFLATVYNRSVDGQGGIPQNIAQMFAYGMPHPEQQNQGSVVDIGDISDVASQPQPHPGSMSPHRRQQRLLMPPPNSARGSTGSPASVSASTPQDLYMNNIKSGNQPGSIEELFESSPSDSTHPNEHIQSQRATAQGTNMLSIINNSNAQNSSSSGHSPAMDFPELLNQYENANGNSPLTNEQRANMLNIMANSSSAAGGGSNSAVVSPAPPRAAMAQLNNEIQMTQEDMDNLLRLQQEQERAIHNVKSVLEPLSPSGSIPGLTENGDYFSNGNLGEDPSHANLDLDQFLDTGAFYNGSSPLGGEGYGGYDHLDASGGLGGIGMQGMGESHFDVGMDGVVENGSGNDIPENLKMEPMGNVGVVESGSSTADEDGGRNGVGGINQMVGGRSPSKRRRKK